MHFITLSEALHKQSGKLNQSANKAVTQKNSRSEALTIGQTRNCKPTRPTTYFKRHGGLRTRRENGRKRVFYPNLYGFPNPFHDSTRTHTHWHAHGPPETGVPKRPLPQPAFLSCEVAYTYARVPISGEGISLPVLAVVLQKNVCERNFGGGRFETPHSERAALIWCPLNRAPIRSTSNISSLPSWAWKRPVGVDGYRTLFSLFPSPSATHAELPCRIVENANFLLSHSLRRPRGTRRIRTVTQVGRVNRATWPRGFSSLS